jgi:alpha-beta hydrolase superfamily lysophospholipase
MIGAMPVVSESSFPVNGLRLHRRSATADGDPWARLIILHGYGDHSGRYAHVMQWMASHGIACHALDFRGHGKSDGKPGFVRRWDEYLDDLDGLLAVDEVRTPENTPLFVLGHSHGGLVAARAAERGRLNSIRGCILSAPYLRSVLPISPMKLLVGRCAHWICPSARFRSGITDDILSSDEAMRRDTREDPLLLHGGTPAWFFEMLKVQEEVLRDSPRLTLPLLCLTAGKDRIADSDVSAEFCRGAGSRDKTHSIYGGFLHELLREAKREAIFEDILGWIRARVAGAPPGCSVGANSDSQVPA